MMTFHAAVPGAWLRDDIANVLTALAANMSGTGEFEQGYIAALVTAATALGLYAKPDAGRVLPTVVVIDAVGREVTR